MAEPQLPGWLRFQILALPAALVAGALLLGAPFRPAPRRPESKGIVQPIAFNHARHAEEDLGCLDCHRTAEASPYASLPKVSACLVCHAEPQGESPEEQKIREFTQRGEEIPWVQVNRVAGHVYFSHAVHVALAKMDCAQCHGDMAAAKEPVTASQVDHLTMRRCMDCHFEKGASNDCLACHK